MKNLKVNKIIMILMAIIMLMAISTKVLATSDDLVNPINILTNVEETPQTNVEQPVTPITNNTVQNTLPQTGDASDYAVFLLIAVCVVVSIYAYKKVRDYNKI